MTEDIFAFFDEVMALAKKKGSDATEVVLSKSTSQNQQVRMGKVEEAERAEGEVLGLKIRIGQKEAATTTNNRQRAAVEALLDKLVAMARVLPDNPFAGEATPEQLYKTAKGGAGNDLQTFDPTDLSPVMMKDMALAAEAAARAGRNIVNSEGAAVSFGHEEDWFAFSNGFRGSESHSHFSTSVAIIAGDGKTMEVDYDYSSKVFFADLLSPEEIGRRAAERASAQLGARQEKSGRYPVVLDPRVASSIIGHLASAINGQKLAKGTSFLQDKLGQKIMADSITMVDDPFRRRGFSSQWHDGEGLPTQRRNIIDKGVLTSYVLDLASARQLQLPPTGHGHRSLTGVYPSLTNVHIAAGTLTPEQLMADIKEGFYVTSVMGFGVNGVTGDYSQGASGFWVVNGQRSHSVNEMTIAGNLKDMFVNMTPANDLEFLHHHNAPTLRIDGMTVAGK